MNGLLLLISGWILVAACSAMLLKYRLLLRHYDRELLKFAPDSPPAWHAALQNRITIIDRWGVSLSAGIVLYTLLFLAYLLYQSLAKITHAILQLLSYI
jgi:hypothetical protein